MSTTYYLHCPACDQTSEEGSTSLRRYGPGLIQAAWHLKRAQELQTDYLEIELMGHEWTGHTGFVIKHALCGTLAIIGYGPEPVETATPELPASLAIAGELCERMLQRVDAIEQTAGLLRQQLEPASTSGGKPLAEMIRWANMREPLRQAMLAAFPELQPCDGAMKDAKEWSAVIDGAKVCLWDTTAHEGGFLRLYADHRDCFNKAQRCPLIVEISRPLTDSEIAAIRRAISWIGSAEGLRMSNAWQYLDPPALDRWVSERKVWEIA